MVALDRLVEGHLAVEVRRAPAVAERRSARCGRRRDRPRAGARTSSTNPASNISRDPLLDPRVQGGPVDVDADLDAARVGVHALGQRRAERSAGDRDDLERPDDPAAVVGQDLRGRRRVDLGEPAVQRRGAALGQLGLEPRVRPASVPGNSNPSSTARVYSAEPPTRTGARAADAQSSIAARAQPWNSATVAARSTSRRSSR